MRQRTTTLGGEREREGERERAQRQDTLGKVSTSCDNSLQNVEPSPRIILLKTHSMLTLRITSVQANLHTNMENEVWSNTVRIRFSTHIITQNTQLAIRRQKMMVREHIQLAQTLSTRDFALNMFSLMNSYVQLHNSETRTGISTVVLKYACGNIVFQAR